MKINLLNFLFKNPHTSPPTKTETDQKIVIITA